MKEIEDKWRFEEEYWGQRARLNWIKYGDKNSKFFHIESMQRMQRNRIVKIRNNAGDWIDDDLAVADCFKDLFVNLFSFEGQRNFDDVLEVVLPIIFMEENYDLLRPIIYEEVRAFVFSLGKGKALGPDGFSGVFL